MTAASEDGKGRRRKCRLLAWSAGLVLLVGCAHPNGAGGDPFLAGGTPLPRTSANPVAAGPAAGTGGAAPLPTTHAITSPAAIAAGPPTPSVGGDLRIGAPGTPTSLGGPEGPGGTSLGGPQPAGGAAAPVVSPSFLPAGGTVSSPANGWYSQFFDELRKRGLARSKTETMEDGTVLVRCWVPKPGAPSQYGAFKVTLTPEGWPVELRDLFDQIDRYRAGK